MLNIDESIPNPIVFFAVLKILIPNDALRNASQTEVADSSDELKLS